LRPDSEVIADNARHDHASRPGIKRLGCPEGSRRLIPTRPVSPENRCPEMWEAQQLVRSGLWQAPTTHMINWHMLRAR
jgi:hypothetical protein